MTLLRKKSISLYFISVSSHRIEDGLGEENKKTKKAEGYLPIGNDMVGLAPGLEAVTANGLERPWYPSPLEVLPLLLLLSWPPFCD